MSDSQQATDEATGTYLSVDVIAITEGVPRLALIERAGEPHAGSTTLPGGLLRAQDSETVEEAARRIITEKVGVEITSECVGLGWVSDPRRDERGHTVSLLVAARVPADTPGAVNLDDIPEDMPFDHTGMATRALATLSERLLTDRETTVALLGEETTVPEVVALVGAVTGDAEHAIRGRLKRSGIYATTERKRPSGGGRPSVVYEAAG